MFRSRRNQALLTIVLFLGALVPGVRVLGRWDSAPSVHSAIQVTTAAQHVTNSGARAVTGSTQELTREPAATITTSSNAIVGDVSGPLVGGSLPVEPRARSDNPDAGRWVVVYFSFACHSVSPKTAKAINHYLAAVPYGATVTVEGHTDHIGTLESNMRLSGKRALAVSSVLPRDRWKLVPRAFGESRPAASNLHPDGTDNVRGRRLNRRVEVRPAFEGQHLAVSPRPFEAGPCA